MASQKKAKRVLSDSDSESEYLIPSTTFARFLVIESADSSKPVTKLSPFIIEKSISAILGTPKSVNHLSPLQKHVRKVVGGFGKKSCVSTGVRKPGNTCASLTAMI